MTNERISLNNPSACVHCGGELPPLEGAGTFYYRFAPNSVTSVRVCSVECAHEEDAARKDTNTL